MTEPEVTALMAEIEATPTDTESERAWAVEMLRIVVATEQRLMSEGRLHRFTRSDEGLKAVAAELKKTRTVIAYLEMLVA